MLKTDSLSILLQEDLKGIFDSEKRLLRATFKLAKAASSDELRSVLWDHLEVTRKQVDRIRQVFDLLGIPPKQRTCAGLKVILAEADEMMLQNAGGTLLDTTIIGAARRMEHYEMAAYSSACHMAHRLDLIRVADLLQETWEEESEADERLSLVTGVILSDLETGRKRMHAGSGFF